MSLVLNIITTLKTNIPLAIHAHYKHIHVVKTAHSIVWMKPFLLFHVADCDYFTYGHVFEKIKHSMGVFAEAKEKLERIYFGGIHTCEELFISRILPGRVDRVYFVGKEHIYVQNYEGMKVGNAKVFFAISMAGLATDEYNIFVESRGVIHRLKNRIRVV